MSEALPKKCNNALSMKIVFPLYRHGVGNAGLVALRLAIGCAVVALPHPSVVPASVVTISLTALLLGAATRTAACCTGVIVISSFTIGVVRTPDLSELAVGLQLAALTMMGPGAFSLDAILSRRKIIHLRPPENPKV